MEFEFETFIMALAFPMLITYVLVEAIKMAGVENKRFIAPISLCLGVFSSWFVSGFSYSNEVIILGLIAGALASGMYSGFKGLAEIVKNVVSVGVDLYNFIKNIFKK